MPVSEGSVGRVLGSVVMVLGSVGRGCCVAPLRRPGAGGCRHARRRRKRCPHPFSMPAAHPALLNAPTLAAELPLPSGARAQFLLKRRSRLCVTEPEAVCCSCPMELVAVWCVCVCELCGGDAPGVSVGLRMMYGGVSVRGISYGQTVLSCCC